VKNKKADPPVSSAPGKGEGSPATKDIPRGKKVYIPEKKRKSLTKKRAKKGDVQR